MGLRLKAGSSGGVARLGSQERSEPKKSVIAAGVAGPGQWASEELVPVLRAGRKMRWVGAGSTLAVEERRWEMCRKRRWVRARHRVLGCGQCGLSCCWRWKNGGGGELPCERATLRGMRDCGCGRSQSQGAEVVLGAVRRTEP